MQIKTRIDIINYLKKNDDSFYKQDNVIYASKAFLINTVIQWCYNQLEIKKMEPNELDFYISSINGFLEGNVVIYWDKDDNLVIS